MRTHATAPITALAIALVAGSPDVREAGAAEPVGASARMQVRESLVEGVRRTGPAGSPVFEVVSRRRATVKVRLGGQLPPAASLDAATPFGLRVGTLVLETTLGEDPAWTPGRRVANFRPLTGDPDARLRVRLRRNRIDVSLRTRTDLLVGDPGDEMPAGALSRPFDAAARLGDASWFLRGSAAGRLRRSEFRLVDTPIPLRGARLRGTGMFAVPEDDPVAPTVTITAPAPSLLSRDASVQVSGLARDDRSIAAVRWSLDGGAENVVPVTADPSLSVVRGQQVTFDFPVSVPAPGRYTVRVAALDAGGSAGSSDVTFTFIVPIDLPLATGGAYYPVSGAVVGGELQTWGDDRVGSLGDGEFVPETQPAPTAIGLTGVRQVSIGSGHALALLDDGTVRAWGENLLGEIGDGTPNPRTAPVEVPGLDDVEEVSAGSAFSLARRSDGTVWGWGAAAGGQLGSNVPDLQDRSLTPVQVKDLADVVDVAAGALRSVALLADGSLRVWGYPATGGQPAGGSGKGAIVQPTVVGGEPNHDFVEVAAGYYTFMARRADGTVVVWGTVGPTSGGIGLGPGVSDARSPTVVPGVTDVVSIAAGHDTFYAVRRDGTILAWGQNGDGQLGDGTQTSRWNPAPVVGITEAVRVHAGSTGNHVIAQLGTNRVMAWGRYSLGTTVPTLPPPTVLPVEVTLPGLE